jgi:hypothetical protein
MTVAKAEANEIAARRPGIVTGDTAANASKASSSASQAAAQTASSSSVTSRPSSRATTSSVRGQTAVNARRASLWRLMAAKIGSTSSEREFSCPGFPDNSPAARATAAMTAIADALANRPRAARRDLGKAASLARTVSFGIV